MPRWGRISVPGSLMQRFSITRSLRCRWRSLLEIRISSTVIKWLLTRLLPGVVLSAAQVGARWWLYSTGYDSGHTDAKAEGHITLAREKKARAEERQQLAQVGQQVLLKTSDSERQQR